MIADMQSNSGSSFANRGVATALVIAAVLVAVQAVSLWWMGLPLVCECGAVDLWHADPSGPQTSQHVTDWYTFTHVIHGFGFYFLLWLVAPRLSFAARLAIAVGLEAGWEVLENTPLVMERYRQSALARGYFGDSVINSIFDTAAMVLGFVLARVLPVWASAALVAALELFLGVMIRDNLMLNIVQLIYPSEALSKWQGGG